jgi:hypothetical protein
MLGVVLSENWYISMHMILNDCIALNRDISEIRLWKTRRIIKISDTQQLYIIIYTLKTPISVPAHHGTSVSSFQVTGLAVGGEFRRIGRSITETQPPKSSIYGVHEGSCLRRRVGHTSQCRRGHTQHLPSHSSSRYKFCCKSGKKVYPTEGWFLNIRYTCEIFD